MRRIAAALLMLCVTAATVNDPAGIYGVKAAEVQERNTESTEDSFEYEELANGGLKLTKYKGSGTKAVIPSAINGKTVAIIGNEAFSGCTGLESITIPESVTNIGEGTEDTGHRYTEYDVFDECRGLKEVIVEEGNAWYSSQDGVLYNKEKTQLILCPAEKEGSVAIAEGVTEIKYDFYTEGLASAFSDCSITSISIPASLVSLRIDLFNRCSCLEEIIVDNDNEAYSSQEGMLYNKNGDRLLLCPAGKKGSITIPEDVTAIEDYNMFGYCNNLTEINVDTNNLYYSSLDGILYNKEKTELIRCMVGKVGRILIPNGVTAINRDAFSGCANLTGITIPEGVVSLPEGAFKDCSSLTEITIPEGVERIGNYVFQGCSSLPGITIPKTVRKIGENMYDEDCPSLVFEDCSSMEEIIVDGNNQVYSSQAGILYSKDMMRLLVCPAGKKGSVAVPERINFISGGAFNGCRYLTEIVANTNNSAYIAYDGVLYHKYIDDDGENAMALLACPGAKEGAVQIPAEVTYIPYNAFNYCNNLTEFTVGQGNQIYSSIDGVLYRGKGKARPQFLFRCPAKKEGSIVIPDETRSIDSYAFKGCSRLESITIPELTSIPAGVFDDCMQNLHLYCVKGSKAESYAVKHGISYTARKKSCGIDVDIKMWNPDEIYNADKITVGDNPFWLIPNAWIYNEDGDENTVDAIFIYESNNDSVVSVSQDGLVTVIGAGTAQITITAAETDEYAAAQKVITITVNPASGTGENPAPPADLVGTSYDIGGCTHTITSVEPKEACFTRLNDEECTSVTMRSVTINGVEYEVSSIAERACCGMETLQRVYIGENVKEIGAGAFAGCAALEQVKIPESVQSIGEGAFAGCGDRLCMICAGGSAAEAYAVENGIRHRASEDGKMLQTITAGDYTKTAGDGPFSIEAATDGDGALSYESDNESVAAVSAKGTVILMGTGTARITIRASGTENYEPAEKTITITVNPKPGEGQNPGTGSNNQPNSGNKKAQTITADDIIKTYGDKAFPIGAGSDGGTLSYTVKNPAVAAIDGNGTVTLKGCGRTEVVITAAAYGEYMAAEKTITLTVAPKKLKGISAKPTKTGTLTVKWKKDTAASGYIIECSTDRKFRKNVKTITVKKNKTTSKKITKLKSGKKYYVRACAYAQAGGAKIKGAYTAGKKAVKVKK